jgi:excinuclease UvrABC nuclease subunit
VLSLARGLGTKSTSDSHRLRWSSRTTSFLKSATREARRAAAAERDGPVLRFVVPNLPEASGVYAIFLDGSLKYVGRALNLKKRFYDYGHIAPRKCYRNGQSTNVAMNKRVREALHVGGKIAVFIRETADYVALEAVMIATLQPPWNVQGVLKAASPFT